MLNNPSDKLLGTKIDKTGQALQIFLAPTLGDSPVLPVFLKEYAALMEQGYAQYNMIGNNRTKAVYAVLDDVIIALMAFDVSDDFIKTTWVNFSFVDPQYRNRGIFKILHQHLEEQVKAAGSKKICSVVHIDNTAILESAKSVGRVPVFYRTEKRI